MAIRGAPRKLPKLDPPEPAQTYLAPDWAWRYVLSVLDVEVKPTITARCEQVGIDRHTFYDATKNPDFVVWLNNTLERLILGEGPEIRSALRRKCLSGDIEAIKLWHELYGKYVPTTRQIVKDEREISELGNAELSEIARILARHDPKGTGETIN